MVTNVFTCRTPDPPGVGSIGQNSTFSEQCQDTIFSLNLYVKQDFECQNMVFRPCSNVKIRFRMSKCDIPPYF